MPCCSKALWPLPPASHAAPPSHRFVHREFSPRFSTRKGTKRVRPTPPPIRRPWQPGASKKQAPGREETACKHLQDLACPCARSPRREPFPARKRAGSGSANSGDRQICTTDAGLNAFFSLITVNSRSCKSAGIIFQQPLQPACCYYASETVRESCLIAGRRIQPLLHFAHLTLVGLARSLAQTTTDLRARAARKHLLHRLPMSQAVLVIETSVAGFSAFTDIFRGLQTQHLLVQRLLDAGLDANLMRGFPHSLLQSLPDKLVNVRQPATEMGRP